MDDDLGNLVRLSEVRKATAQTPCDLTPRDVLENVLAKIASGELNPDALIVCYREKLGPGRTATGYEQCGPDIHTSLGILDYVSKRMYDGTQLK